MMQPKISLSVLIVVDDLEDLRRYNFVSCLSRSGTSEKMAEVVVGLTTEISDELVRQSLNLSGNDEVQTVRCNRGETMLPHAELAFAARGECLLIATPTLAEKSDHLNVIVELILQSADKAPLAECFYWGSTASAPASYTIFGSPPHLSLIHI